MQSTRANRRKWIQAGLLSTLVALVAGQWRRILEWMDGLPHLIQLAIGSATVVVLMVLLAYVLWPFLNPLFTLLTL